LRCLRTIKNSFIAPFELPVDFFFFFFFFWLLFQKLRKWEVKYRARTMPYLIYSKKNRELSIAVLIIKFNTFCKNSAGATSKNTHIVYFPFIMMMMMTLLRNSLFFNSKIKKYFIFCPDTALAPSELISYYSACMVDITITLILQYCYFEYKHILDSPNLAFFSLFFFFFFLPLFYLL
jgi:hypothetical protein